MTPETFSGTIVVASSIVDQLSSGLYESPAACLKELINNSYDADAEVVEVLMKPDADRIIIEDDGIGMNRADFERHFSRVSESHKRDDGDVTESGRKMIGKIGIGFIAANEICDTMEIFSTKEGSKDLLHVEIHFDRMRQDPAKRRREGGDFEKGDYTGEVLVTENDSHYTQVILKRVRTPELFAGEGNKSIKGDVRTLYGLTTESVEKALSDTTLISWAEFDEYSQNMLHVALNVPVRYFKRWIPKEHHGDVAVIELAADRLGFELRYDGTPVRKPTLLRPPPGKRCFVEKFELKGNHVSAEGYFYAQHGTIQPRELQGLLIRIREAAVGEYDTTFLGFPPTEGSLIQRWVSAEIRASDELENALNIDRKTLRLTEPAYLELQAAIHAQLRSVLTDARDRLYSAGSKDRDKKKLVSAVESAREFARTELEPLNPAVARTFVSSWERASKGKQGPTGSLLRKFTVIELYQIVLAVAREMLSETQLKEFILRLTKRLSR